MLQSDHYELLDRLRLSKSEEDRRQALNELMIKEQNGEFEQGDMISLLENRDPVYQAYAIGAVGRIRMEGCASQLKSIFLKSNNPLILVALLDAFLAFESDEFIDAVIKKLKNPRKKAGFLRKETSLIETAFDSEMILDQILVPALKYLQVAGNGGIGKKIEIYLAHDDSTVRWHTLSAFDKLSIPLDNNQLAEIKATDENALVREQAAIMLEKSQTA